MKIFARSAFCFIALAALIAGCSKGGGVGGILGGNQPASDFPVYTPSTVVTSGKYDDSAEITTLGSNFFGGNGDDKYKPYIGVQELIKTSATLDQLNAWLVQIVQSPPPNLYPSQNTVARVLASPAPEESGAPAAAASGDPPAPAASGDSPAPATSGDSPAPVASSDSATPAASTVTTAPAPTDSASPAASGAPETLPIEDPFVDSFKAFGLVPAGFWSKDRGRVVMIIILDPKQVADHLGSTMQLMDQYDKLPPFLRSGIDAAVKKQSGFAISDLMNTNTPMGMIVYAARNYKNEDSRVIILVDALRQANTLPTPHASGQ
jgi:hypothetical protein